MHKAINKAKLVALDTETTSLDYMEAELVGISLSVEAGKAAYLPLAHDYPGAPEQLLRDEVLEKLRAWLEDPAKEKLDAKKQITLAELCDLYVEQGCTTKKASTLATDKGRIERHIKPLLGKKKVPEITRADIKRFLQDVANGKTANRTTK